MKRFFLLILIIFLFLLTSGCSGLLTPIPPSSIEGASVSEVNDKIDSIEYLTGNSSSSRGIVANKPRPAAVVIDNSTESLPQYGISKADILFEIPSKGNSTALLAVYPNSLDLPKLSKIGNNKKCFEHISAGFDAIYICNDNDSTVESEIELDIIDIDSPGISGKEIADIINRNDFKTEIETSSATAFPFSEGAFSPILMDAGEVKVDFGGGMYSNFKYMPDEGVYKKFFQNDFHVDAAQNKQLSFTNLFVLESDIDVLVSEDERDVDFSGGTKYKGYYVSKGGQQRISWYKADESSEIELFDENNNKLIVNPGKSYIAVVSKNHDTFYLDGTEA